MTTDTIKDMGPHFHRAADSLADALARLDNARLERLQFLRRCSKDSTARLAALKEEVRTLPEQIAKWDAEAARLESQTAEDLLRQALEPVRQAEEQPTMSCPSCKREYPDFDGAGVVFCDPKQGGCGFCRHVELRGQPMGDKTVMVCTACWEAQEEEQPKPEPYRAGLPPESLRKVWAEWEVAEENGGVCVFIDGDRYYWKSRGLITAKPTSASAFDWQREASLRPHGATWSRVEAMADEAEKQAHDGYLGFKVGARPIAIPPEHRDEVPMCDAGCKVFSDGWQHYRTCKYVAWMQGKDLPAEQEQAPTLLDLTKLPPGTVCEAMREFGLPKATTHVRKGDRFEVTEVDVTDPEFTVQINLDNLPFWSRALVPARVVKEGGEQ